MDFFRRMPSFAFLVAIPIASCSDSSGAPSGDLDASPPANPDASPTDGARPDADHAPMRFTEDFEGVDRAPYTDPYPELPEVLFPEDGSRWTQVQDTDVGKNRIGLLDARGGTALFCEAIAGAPKEAVKIDLGKQNLSFFEGDVVRLKADFYVDPNTGGDFAANTLLDLEEGDDLLLDGDPPTAGLRIKTNAEGRIALDRGELVGRDADEEPHFRLSSFTSETAMPIGQWVRLDVRIKLGTGVTRSTSGPIDDSFDAGATAAWAEIWMTPDGGKRERVLRMRGTTFLDRQVGLPLLEEQDPDVDVTWPESYDYDTFQVGLTNNRSERPQRLLVDNVAVERM